MPEENNIKFELTQPEFERLNSCLEEYMDDLDRQIIKAEARYRRTKGEMWLRVAPAIEADKSGIQKIINHLSAREHVT